MDDSPSNKRQAKISRVEMARSKLPVGCFEVDAWQTVGQIVVDSFEGR